VPIKFLLTTAIDSTLLQILFEDGDRLDGVFSHNLYTEKQYMVKFGEKPPEPKQSRAETIQNESSLKMPLNVDHALFGKGFCRKWIDVSGRPCRAFGTIAEGSESLHVAKEKLFKVKYDSVLQDLATDVYGGSVSVSPVGNVTEMAAWGGYLTFVEEVHGLDAVLEIKKESPVPFHLKWLLPGMRGVDGEGRLVMEFRGFRLEFEVKPSKIRGAGLGLWLTCFCACAAVRTHFVLKRGELLGLGPYAPLHRDDRKSYHVFQVKNFIHNYEPGVFVFDANVKENEMYDITDDKTGDLHDKAAKNLLARVNETDGEEDPSVFADYDPYGAVHYYLGQSELEQGDLQVQVEKPFELKVRLSLDPRIVGFI
jgi:hypothetical protein